MRYLVLLLLLVQPAFGDQYDDALKAARDAAYMQSGLADDVDKIKKYAANKAKEGAEQTGLTEHQVRVIAGIFGGTWYAYKHQEFIIPVNQSSNITLSKFYIVWEHSF